MSRTIGFIIYFIILLNGTCLNGQIKTNVPKSEIDSLIGIVPNFQGAELVDHLNLIATSISQRYPDSCLYYANQALELADSLDYEIGNSEAIFNIGNGYFYKIDLKNSLTNYLTALRLLEKFGDIDCHANLLLQIGFINTFVGNRDKAIEYYRRAQLIFNATGNQYAVLYVKYKIGDNFRRMNEKDSALYYFNKILPECKQLGHKRFEAWILRGIGLTFVVDDGMKALPYYEKSLKITRDISDSYSSALVLACIGTLYQSYLSEPDFEKAETYLLKSMHGFEKIGNSTMVAWEISYLGDLYVKHGKINKAKNILNKGLEIVKYINISKDAMVSEYPDSKLMYSVYAKKTITWIYEDMQWVYEAERDFEKAHYYNKLKVQAADSIYSETNRRQIDVILANAENESNTQKIQLLEKEKELQEERAQRSILFLIGSGILIVLIIIIALLFIRQKRSRIEQEKTNLQQKLLRSQMNPHFIFNSLSSIQGFITEKDPRTANRYLSRFAKLIRNILDSSVEEFIPLAEEIVTIENYLELQKVRYEGKFDYTIEVDETIDTETMTIPPMLAQPFIENSIEHGFKHKKNKGVLKILFSLENNLLRIEVIDDGIGRAMGREIIMKQNQKHKSLATSLTQERIRTLNKKLKRKVSLSIQDLTDDKHQSIGTKVEIIIPV